MTEDRREAHESALFWDLVHDVSLDTTWRQRLFTAEVGRRFPFDAEDVGRLSASLREFFERLGLQFACFNDGWTEDGFVVFGLEAVEFPEVVAYSTNTPDITS